MIRYIGDFSALCAEKSPPAGIMRSSGEDFGSPGGGFGSSGAGFSSVGPFWARRVEVSARQLRDSLRTSIRPACPRIPAGCVLALDVPSMTGVHDLVVHDPGRQVALAGQEW